jgi:hypothetical protein
LRSLVGILEAPKPGGKSARGEGARFACIPNAKVEP